MQKPVSFKIAAIFYLIGMIALIINEINLYYSPTKPENYFWSPVVFVLIIIITILLFFLILKGLNWFRYFYAVTFLSSIISMIYSYFVQIIHIDIFTKHQLIGLFSILTRGVSFYFLFNKDSNDYIAFKKMKKARG